MRLFPSIKNLTRQELEERFDKAAAQFLRSRDAESRSEVIELHDRLKEIDNENRIPIPVLQLRDHPLMERESGHVLWPPVWTRIGDNDVITVTGEVGYLEQVRVNDALNACVFLTISHEGAKYVGSMTFDDPAFCLQLCELLESKIGLSIKEIGDLDLSHWL